MEMRKRKTKIKRDLSKKNRKKFCERRDLNPYAEALDPKSSVYANFTTLADYRHGQKATSPIYFVPFCKAERNMSDRGLEPRTHRLRVCCSTN